MAESTGPILAIGAITVANQSIFNGEDIDWRVPVATGFTALLFAAAEKAWPAGVRGVAWLALVTVLFVRTNPKVPSPIESGVEWWEKGGKKTPGKSRTASV